MSDADRIRQLEGQVEMLRKSVEHMINLSQTGRMEDDPDKPADMPSISVTYLEGIEKFGKDVLAWLEKHGGPKPPKDAAGMTGHNQIDASLNPSTESPRP